MRSHNWILIFAMFFPTLAALSYFEFFSAPETVQSLYSASKILQFSLPLLVIYFLRRRRWSLRRPTKVQIKSGIAWGVLFAGSLIATYFGLRNFPFMVNVKPLLQEKMMAFDATKPHLFFLFGAFVSIIHSFLEEYYWRWYVHRELKQYFSSLRASLVSGFAFMAHHVVIIQAYLPEEIYWPGIFIFPVYVWIAGSLWAWLYDRHQSLWIPWISHIMADVAIFWVGYQILWT